MIAKILQGFADKNIDFSDLCHILLRLGFEERSISINRKF